MCAVVITYLIYKVDLKWKIYIIIYGCRYGLPILFSLMGCYNCFQIIAKNEEDVQNTPEYVEYVESMKYNKHQEESTVAQNNEGNEGIRQRLLLN